MMAGAGHLLSPPKAQETGFPGSCDGRRRSSIKTPKSGRNEGFPGSCDSVNS